MLRPNSMPNCPVCPCYVQELTAPHVLRGRNVVVAAETGSGKTLAFLAPIAHLMTKQRAALERYKQELEQQQQQGEEPRSAEER